MKFILKTHLREYILLLSTMNVDISQILMREGEQLMKIPCPMCIIEDIVRVVSEGGDVVVHQFHHGPTHLEKGSNLYWQKPSLPTSSRSIQTSSVSRNLGTLIRKAAMRAGAMKIDKWRRDE